MRFEESTTKINRFLLFSLLSTITAIILNLTTYILKLPTLGIISTIFLFVTLFFIALIPSIIRDNSKDTQVTIDKLSTAKEKADILFKDLLPIIEFLEEADKAILSAIGATGNSSSKPNTEEEAYTQLRTFVSEFHPLSADSLARITSYSKHTDTVKNLQEIELRLPYINELLTRVVSHTESAAMTLISRFGSISEKTDRAASDGKSAMAALGVETNIDEGLDALIKKSHESVVGRTEVINDFLKLNHENEERLRKIATLVNHTEELISGIEDIAEKSKLITFNLAVESAKIGNKGLGFKVIVDELQRLNDQTTKFAHDILEIVKSFRAFNQELMEQWIEKSDALTEKVRSDSDQAELAVTALSHSYDIARVLFRSISESAVSVNESMSDILASLQFQDITRQQIEGVMSFLSDISKDIKNLRSEFESTGFSTGDIPTILHTIRKSYQPKLKVSSDHDVFDLLERRYI